MVILKETISNGKYMLTDEILNDEKVFKIWFVNTYLSKFDRYPNFDSFELANMVNDRRNSLEEYFNEVSHFISMCLYGEDISKRIFQNSRKKEVVMVSKITCYILVEKLRFSKCGVARVINRNHATVIHHCNTVKGFLVVDKEFSEKMKYIFITLRKMGLIL